MEIINIFRSKCNCESYLFQKYLHIPLLLPNEKEEISLYELINSYVEEEHISLPEQNMGYAKCLIQNIGRKEKK